MDSTMGELAEGNLDASDSSTEEINTGSVRINGEVNGLGDDPLELSGEEKITSLKSALSGDLLDKVSESDDDSIISSKENGTGSVKVPNKDSVKINISGTKVPTSVVDVSKMEVHEIDSDTDDISAIEDKDPLELSDAHSNSIDKTHVENISDGMDSSDTIDINGTTGDSENSNVLSDKNHKVNDKKVKENGGSVHLRSPDIEEISNDSVKFSKELDASDKIEELDRDGDSRDGSHKSGETTPAKVKKSRKSIPPANLTPRRSSRNLTRVQKSYSEPKEEPDVVEPEEESDIEEIHPVDPLADVSKPIIVKDTRKLVEIAAGARSMKGGAKKEPTLVIIDTNSILAGRGPVPMSQSQSQSHRHSSPLQLPSTSRSTQGYTIHPVNSSSQGMVYPKARITPYPHSYARVQPIPIHIPAPKPQPLPPPPPPPPQILPTLTDDMYVVEAPSFIVPYVYEKPPIKPMKEYIQKLSIEIARLTKLEEEEEEKREEEEKKKEEEKKRETDEKTKESNEKKDKDEKQDEEKKEKKDADKKVENDTNENKDTVKLDMEVDEEPELATTNKDNLSKEIENAKGKEESDSSEKDVKKIDPKLENSENEVTTKIEDNNKSVKEVEEDEIKIIIDLENKDDSLEKLKDKLITKEASTDEPSKEKLSTDVTSSDKDKPVEDKPKISTYFDNPLGKFFMQIGTNLVTEFVQTDLLRHQRRKRDREGKISTSAQYAVNALMNNLEISKENNKPFHLPIKKCEFCSFKTESELVMAQHLETPHMRNYIYRCNFCPLEVRGPHDILFHMEAEHNVRGRLDRAPAFHQCPSCPFEDNQKGKLTRHIMTCAKKYKPEKNLEPPTDWEPPAKIPRVSRNRPTSMGLGTAAYQAMIAKQGAQHPLLPKLMPTQAVVSPATAAVRGRGRPTMQARFMPDMKITAQGQRPIVQASQIRPGMLYRPSSSGSHPQTLLPNTYQIANNQLFQGTKKNTASKLPSISITPLPRQTTVASPQANNRQQSPQAGAQGKTYVICEICDGYIKDLEQLRNHMLWIHKVKIHPKMIHNRPPLNCQKCQCRFFTDQGLERHLLGTHGLVTSSMQEAANRGKDAGRCPACGRVYQWKLLNHVARDHGMVLKPAHLSYKCTVCTATFGMYKQFENHVYSAHSTQAKRVMDKKPASTSQVYRPQPNEAPKSLLKPLKMNDEITIIPQHSATPRPQIGPASKTGRPAASLLQSKYKDINCELCEDTFGGAEGFSRYLSHMRKSHLQTSVKICRIDSCPNCPTCKSKYFTESIREYLEENKKCVDVIELSDDEVVMAGQGRNEITITKVSCSPGPRRFKHRLQHSRNVQVIELDDSPRKSIEEPKENGEDSLTAVKERLRRRKSLEISQVDSEDPLSEPGPSKKRRRHND